MASSVLTSLALVFLAAGLTLLLTSVALTRRARRFQRGMQALLALGTQGLAPLDIPAAAWPVLLEAGWQRLLLTGHWFGATVQLERGPVQKAANTLVFQINGGDDVSLMLSLTHRATRGEVWLFAEQLARVLVLLLETGVRARTEAMSVALAERARLSLYLQHDMRNLAQWAGWVCADFAACEDASALLAAGQRLRDNAPLALERVHRLRDALAQKPGIDRPRQIDLAAAITKAAHLAGVEVTLSGEAQAWIARGLLARVLDNLLSNLAPNWRDVNALKPTFHLCLLAPLDGQAARAQVEFLSPWPLSDARLPQDQLFEPFTSGRPGGLGLGLYQARKSLGEAGGELSAQATEQGLRFRLRMPGAPP